VVFSLVISVCATFVAVSEGKCSRENALHVSQTTVEAIDSAAAQNVCVREAFQALRSFRSPTGEPVAVAWSCSAVDTDADLRPSTRG
jgi:hypothetical protein